MHRSKLIKHAKSSPLSIGLLLAVLLLNLSTVLPASATTISVQGSLSQFHTVQSASFTDPTDALFNTVSVSEVGAVGSGESSYSSTATPLSAEAHSTAYKSGSGVSSSGATFGGSSIKFSDTQQLINLLGLGQQKLDLLVNFTSSFSVGGVNENARAEVNAHVSNGGFTSHVQGIASLANLFASSGVFAGLGRDGTTTFGVSISIDPVSSTLDGLTLFLGGSAFVTTRGGFDVAGQRTDMFANAYLSVVSGAGALTLSDGITTLESLGVDYSFMPSPNASAVPLPSSLWLFGTGLVGLFGISRRKKPLTNQLV